MSSAKKFRIWFWLAILIVLAGGIIALVVIPPRMKAKEAAEVEKNLPPIQIELLNGCGVPDVARKVRDRLLDHNIDVIRFGNAKKYIYNKSIIVVRKDHKDDLERLKANTGIDQVVYALDEMAETPFQIIIGDDYKRFLEN